MLWIGNKIEVCKKCNQPILSEKFIDRTYYLAEEIYLVHLLNEELRVAGCLDCLGNHNNQSRKFISRKAGAHRDIYSYKPTLFEWVKMKFRFVFKRKAKTHEESE